MPDVAVLNDHVEFRRFRHDKQRHRLDGERWTVMLRVEVVESTSPHRNIRMPRPDSRAVTATARCVDEIAVFNRSGRAAVRGQITPQIAASASTPVPGWEEGSASRTDRETAYRRRELAAFTECHGASRESSSIDGGSGCAIRRTHHDQLAVEIERRV